MTSLLRPRESAAGLTTGEGEWRPRGLRLPSNPRVTVRVKATWRARRSRAAPAHPPTVSPTAGMQHRGKHLRVASRAGSSGLAGRYELAGRARVSKAAKCGDFERLRYSSCPDAGKMVRHPIRCAVFSLGRACRSDGWA